MKNSKNQFRTNEQALIQDVLQNGKQGRTWFQIAQTHNIRPDVTDPEKRKKSANDVWRRYNRITHIDTTPTVLPPHIVRPLSDMWTDLASRVVGNTTPQVTKPKRLFYDIETSYNIVKAWRIGYNLNINMDDILHERAIITIAYKWEGEDNVEVLQWDKGDDKKLIQEFVKVMAEADELVGHNVDRFDTKFVMARALKHDISVLPKYQSTDTLKLAKKHFMLNSNKLDYIAQYLGLGHKTKHRGMSMWDDIILRNDPDAMEEMINYNVQDVYLTEKVYHKLMEYSLPRVNHASKVTGDKHTCPECGSDKAELVKTYITPTGSKSRLLCCSNDKCNTHYTVNETNYKKYYEQRTTTE